MSADGYRVRRATTDDVLPLLVLWETNRLPAQELEKRFTDFQVVEDGKGQLLGAIGIQVSGCEAHLHSEGFVDFAKANSIRPLLWDRVQQVARNYRLARVWTRETAPFWKQTGFAAVEGPLLEKLPRIFGEPDSHWLNLQLREDKAMPISLEREFEMFIQEERGRTEGVMQQARMAKWVLNLILAALILALLIGLIVAVKQGRAGP